LPGLEVSASDPPGAARARRAGRPCAAGVRVPPRSPAVGQSPVRSGAGRWSRCPRRGARSVL